jgi:hypothetical protein
MLWLYFALQFAVNAAIPPQTDAKVILETRDVAVLVTGDWCRFHTANVHLVHRIAWTQELRDTPEFRARFVNEILPVVRGLCESDVAFIQNHVAGARITADGVQKVDRYENALGRELSNARVEEMQDGSWKWDFSYWGATTRYYGPGDSAVASVAAIQSQLRSAPKPRVQEASAGTRAPLDCDTLKADPKSSRPSPHAICHAMREEMDSLAAAFSVTDTLTTQLLGKRAAPPTAIHIVAFTLKNCARGDDQVSYVCDYVITTRAEGGDSNPQASILRATVSGTSHARSDFVREGSQWSYRPPPPTPYLDLPCCWSGDIRVRWMHCQEGCSH